MQRHTGCTAGLERSDVRDFSIWLEERPFPSGKKHPFCWRGKANPKWHPLLARLGEGTHAAGCDGRPANFFREKFVAGSLCRARLRKRVRSRKSGFSKSTHIRKTRLYGARPQQVVDGRAKLPTAPLLIAAQAPSARIGLGLYIHQWVQEVPQRCWLRTARSKSIFVPPECRGRDFRPASATDPAKTATKSQLIR
jgi:hypothetical protein